MNLNRSSGTKNYLHAQRTLSPMEFKPIKVSFDKKKQNPQPFDVSGTDFSINSPTKPLLLRSEVSPVSTNSFDIELCNVLSKETSTENDAHIKIQYLERTIEENRQCYENDKKMMQDYNGLLKRKLQILAKIPSLSKQDTLELDEENFFLRGEVEKFKKISEKRERDIRKLQNIIYEREKEIEYMASKMKEQRDENDRSMKYEEKINLKAKDDYMVKLRLENIDLIEEISENKIKIQNLSQELKKHQSDHEVFTYRSIANECNQKINTALERFQSEFIKIQNQAERIDSRLALSCKTIKFLQNITISDKYKASLLEQDIKEKSDNFVRTINSRNEMIGEKSSAIARLEVRIKELINEISEKMEIIESLNEKITKLNKNSEEYGKILNHKSIELESIAEKYSILEADNAELLKNEKDYQIDRLEKSKEVLRLSIEIEELKNFLTAFESKLESKDNQINVYELQINDLESNCDSLKELNTKYGKIFEEKNLTIQNLERAISENELNVDDILLKKAKVKNKLKKILEINKSLEKEQASVKKKIDLHLSELLDLSIKVEHLENQALEKEIKYKDLEASIDQALNKKNTEIELIKEIHSDEITDMKQTILDQNSVIAGLKEDIENMSNDLELAHSELQGQLSQILEKEQEVKELEKIEESLIDKNRELESLREVKDKEILEINPIILNQRTLIEDLENKLANISKDFEVCQDKLANRETEISDREAEYSELKSYSDKILNEKNNDIEAIKIYYANEISNKEKILSDLHSSMIDQENKLVIASKKLEGYESELLRKDHIYTELENRLKKLVIDTNREIEILKETHSQEIKEKNKEIEVVKEMYKKDINEKNKLISLSKDSNKKEINEKNKEIEATKELLNNEINEKIKEIEAIKGLFNKDINEKNKEIELIKNSLRKEINEKDKEIEIINHEHNEELKERMSEFEKAKEAYNLEGEERSQEIEAIKESLTKELNNKNKSILEQQGMINSLEARLKKVLDESKQNYSIFQGQLSEKEKECSLLENENKDLINKIDESAKTFEEEISLCKLEREDLIASIRNDYENQLKRLYDNIEELKHIYENKLLEIQNESLQSIEKANALKKKCSGLKSILTQKSDEAITNIESIKITNNQILLLFENEAKKLADCIAAINKGENTKFEEIINESSEFQGLEGATSFNIQFYLERIKQELKSALQIKSDISSEYSKIVASRNESIQKQNLLIKQLEKSKLDLNAALESNKRQYQAKSTSYEAKIGELSDKNIILESSNFEIQEELIRCKKDITKLSETIQSNLKDISEKEASHSKELSSNKSELERLRSLETKLKSDIAKANSSIKDQELKLGILESNLKEAKNKEATWRARADNSEKKNKGIVESITDAHKFETNQLKKEISGLESKISEYEKKIEADMNIISKLKENNFQRQNTNTMRNLESKLKEKESEINELYQENERLRIDLERYKELETIFQTMFEKLTDNETMLSELTRLNVNSYEGRKKLKEIMEKSEQHVKELQAIRASVNLAFKSFDTE